MHRFDVKTIKNLELRRKTFQTTQNYESDHINRFRSKQLKTTKTIKLQWIASIWRHNDKKCWVTSQNIPNNAKLRKWSKYNYLHRFRRQKIKNVALSRKTSKQRQTTKVIKLQWIASIWRHNDKKCWVTSQCNQNNAKLQKWSYNDEFASISCQNDQNNSKLQKRSNYNELHRFDVITIKMLSYVAMHSKQHKTTKVIKLQWLASIWCQNIENNPKLK